MNKTALITGTTSGIGYALCEKFAQEKIDLILVSRNHENLQKQQECLQEEYGVKTWAIAQDLESPDAASKIYENLRRLEIDIDYLVHNAGFDAAGKFVDIDIEKEKGMIQLHTVFVTELTKMILPGMVSRKSGKILFIGSTASCVPCPMSAVYSATKSYILFFSRAVREELKGTGVTATTICPGATRTKFAEKADLVGAPIFSNRFVMEPEKVADAGYRSMMKGKVRHIPGIYNKILVFSSKIMPSTMVDRSTAKMMTKRQ
ncbi:MAG: SDR family oxidoreductase [Methanomassiliicoccaceae archaeon]|nr:SDR family oxidoreductase [Methanomassiliicoccaceae archaeon]